MVAIDGGLESKRDLPAHADLPAIGAFEAHAAISPARTVFRPPIDWAAPIPPITIAAADALAGVVIANGANLMITPSYRLAIARAEGGSGLNPTGIRPTVLSCLR